MKKKLHLEDRDVNRLITDLREINKMAFYGHHEGKDNQEQIDIKSRELMQFLNSKIKVILEEKDKEDFMEYVAIWGSNN